ncbi:MAG: Na+/H+ antiporter NhaC family protein [Lentisphaeria bacterium]|nr:Na+/H+ antiporter NhaC family protein [Lentisphaeria bacterium]
MNNTIEPPPRFAALIPFFIFVLFYAGLSILAQNFYAVPMPVAFAAASASAFFIHLKTSVTEKVNIYVSGMGESNIMLMCLIFILAGAFASVAKNMGAVDAAVLITRSLIPSKYLLAGIFVIASLISLAIGTSCGTIAALTPIAAGLIAPMGIRPELMLGAVIGGAMFGDNLSMISDTTIAATRTQNVSMQDKFYANFKMVIPAAVMAVIIYIFAGNREYSAPENAVITWKHILLIVPYILVMVMALCGINVMVLLFFGVVFASTLGICTGTFDIWGALNACGQGTLGMSETLIVAILAGGLLKLIRWNGGIAYLMDCIRKTVHSRRGCEIGIFMLVSAVNLFTANNTVAIVIAGPIAKELSDRYGCEPRRVASILDTASCFVQGLIPYGAQVLIAVGIAGNSGITVSAAGLFCAQFYPWLMLAAVIMSFICRRRSTV